MASFLQDHYSRYRQAGGDHAEYVIINDLEDGTVSELLARYNTEFPTPVPDKRMRKFRELLDKETSRHAVIDDLEWLLGKGKYGQ